MRRQRMVEVLIAIGIVALLVSIVLPTLQRQREYEAINRCPRNLRQLGEGLLLYALEHDGAYPPDLRTLVPLYFDGHAEILNCPFADPAAGPTAYVYHRPPMSLNDTPPDFILIEDAPTHTDEGENVVFGDGHVEFVFTRALPAARQRSAEVAATRPSLTASTRPQTPATQKTAG